MMRSQYDRAAIRVLADHLDSEAPVDTVTNVLSEQGRRDVIETIADVYPEAFLTMCAKHQEEIEREVLADYGVTR